MVKGWLAISTSMDSTHILDMKSKYIGIKVKGIDTDWLWFKREKVTETATDFEAVEGWGNGGVMIQKFSVASHLIEGRMESDNLHNND